MTKVTNCQSHIFQSVFSPMLKHISLVKSKDDHLVVFSKCLDSFKNLILKLLRLIMTLGVHCLG